MTESKDKDYPGPNSPNLRWGIRGPSGDSPWKVFLDLGLVPIKVG